ncbi:MAG: helix-turn-helix transcriptional regulator [Nitrospiraceae bacterium]|nr:helix-turn-helix transcriptional regulator [Nitrospiraceae bacterium]
MVIKNLIGIRIQILRKSRGMSQVEFADKMGINPECICRIEQGKEDLTSDILIKLAETLNVELSEILVSF